MEIENERIRSLLREIEKNHEEGLLSDEAYSLLKRDYEKKLKEPQGEREIEGRLEERVFFTKGFKIETRRGIVEMRPCHFVPVSSSGRRTGGIFFGNGTYRMLHGNIEGALEGTTLILKEDFSPEGEEVSSQDFLEKARKAFKEVRLQYVKDGWWIKNNRRMGFGLFRGWSCEIELSDTKVEVRTPIRSFSWGDSVELNEPTKGYQEKDDCITLKTPTMTLELSPESLSIRRPAESVYLSSNELKVDKPANKVVYKNWEEGIAPYRKKIRQDLERALDGLTTKAELEKYRFLFEGEEKGEKEILVDKPASKFEMGEEGLKVESPTSKVFVGKDGKVFIRTPTSHISIPGHGGKIDMSDVDYTLDGVLRNLDLDLGTCGGELEKALRNVERKKQEIEKEIGRMHDFDISYIPPVPPIPPLPPHPPLSHDQMHHRKEGEEYHWKGVLDNPSFFITCDESIEITGREGNEYRVRIDEDGEPDFRIEGNRVFLTSSQDVSMHVPKNCEIALENTGGDSEIKGIVGNLTIHAFSGDVEVEDTMAETMRITADSGDVSLDNVSGHKAIIESLSGSVEGDIKFLECLMNLSSGDALLDVGEGDYTIEAASGNIEISPSGPYNLDAACSVGEITVAGEEKGQEYRISQENSKITLRLRADSGDIELD